MNAQLAALDDDLDMIQQQLEHQMVAQDQNKDDARYSSHGDEFLVVQADLPWVTVVPVNKAMCDPSSTEMTLKMRSIKQVIFPKSDVSDSRHHALCLLGQDCAEVL